MADGSIQSSFEIEDEGTIQDVNVYLDIECNSTSALKIVLEAPSGDEVILVNELDNDGQNFEATFFDDESAVSIWDGFPPYNDDVYRPDGALSLFDGQSITGTWQLTISDLGGGSTGQLNSWNVCIVSVPEPEDCVSYAANDPQLPLALVSDGGVMSSFEIEDEGLIVDVNVLLDITCNSTSALEVKLQAPSGDMIMLFNEVDNDGMDFNNTGLDDEGAYSVYVGFPPFRNTYLPGQPLSTFDGQSITGTWQLYVTDLGGGGIGTINSWSLCLKTVPEQEGEVETEGEGETPTEGEGEAITEGETPDEGEGETVIEGETPAEGEGEAITEGETPAEGEGEEEGEGEAAGCCKAEGKDLILKDLIEKTLGDWLVIGLVMMTSLAMSMSTKRGL